MTEIGDVLSRVIRLAADRFASSLDDFQPWQGKNAITERNLSFQFARAFLDCFPAGQAFFELPFMAAGQSRAQSHLDAYLYTSDLGVCLEFKIVFQQDHIRAIEADMARMRPEFLDQVLHCHRGTKPKTVGGLVLAETWRRDNCEWWEGAADRKPHWRRKGLTDAWTYGFHRVFSYGQRPEETLYWLHAHRVLSSNLEPADNSL